MSRIGRARAALRAFEEGTTAVSQPEPLTRPNLRVVGGTDG